MQEQSQDIDLYYWPTPNGWKISIMLEECKLPYKINYVDITKGEQFEAEFLKISPNNRIPAIVDRKGPHEKPLSLFESGAILVYLAEKTGLFYDVKERYNINEWLFWQIGGLGPMAGQAHHFRKYAFEEIPYAIQRYTNECNRLYGVMNRRLEQSTFLGGESYSIADISCIGWASLWEGQGQDIKQFPHLKRWLDTVLSRQAVQKGLQIGIERR